MRERISLDKPRAKTWPVLDIRHWRKCGVFGVGFKEHCVTVEHFKQEQCAVLNSLNSKTAVISSHVYQIIRVLVWYDSET